MGGNLRELCIDLMHSDSEEEVVGLLKSHGYWENESLWRWLGDVEYNYSSIGNQQSRSEQAIVEKLINAIDTKMMAASRLAGIHPEAPEAPDSILAAREQFFREELKIPEQLSRGITVSVTGAKPPGRPCFSIADDGEGQTPESMPDTILSLHAGNKDKIKFVQGKFNVGGTGVLEFCSPKYNLQLIVSKRNPALLENENTRGTGGNWSFTIVRREDPGPGGKSSRFSYLAPINSEKVPRQGDLLSFSSDSLPIFPDRNLAYSREANWGTLLKLYEYDAQRFRQTMMREGSLLYRARLLLPEPALPMRFHECRDYKGHSGSFDTTMVGLIKTLDDDIADHKRDNVSYYDRREFNVDGDKYTARIYVFKSKSAAETYRKDEGIVFTMNGQCHAILSKDFFRRNTVRQDYLWHSLLVIVDCSEIKPRTFEQMFMTSRDRLREGDVRRGVEREIEYILRENSELSQIASERRKKEITEQQESAQSMAKAIEGLLKNNKTLMNLLGQGARIKNPYKPSSVGISKGDFIGNRFPSKFRFKGKPAGYKLQRDAHIGSHVRITFETDATNDYFKRDDQPGHFSLYRLEHGERVEANNYQSPRLHDGFAHMSLLLPKEAILDSTYQFIAEVTDPSQIEPFTNLFSLTVKKERTRSAGGSGSTNRSTDSHGKKRGSGTGNSKNQAADAYLDIPTPIHVYEKDWKNHDPYFDKYTGARIIRKPGFKDGDSSYDYYVNMDNVFIQSYAKSKPKLANVMYLRYSIGMILISLSILHRSQMIKDGAKGEDFPTDDMAVEDRVQQITSALAPFFLPIVESLNELNEDVEYFSASAGEIS